MNIVLVGFRCAGKSSVGKVIAERLGTTFVDCDEYIEQKSGLSIKEIFERKGESFFRLAESDVIAELSKLDGVVIATGGGAVLRYKNIHNLKRNGFLIHLEVDADSASERIRRDPATKKRRPSLSDKDIYAEIRGQMEFRKAYYAQAADLVVQTTEKAIDRVVEEILEHLRNHGFTLRDPD